MNGALWAAGAEVLPDGNLRVALLATDGKWIGELGPCAKVEASSAPLEDRLAAGLNSLSGWGVAGVILPKGLVLNGATLAEATGRGIAWDFDAADRMMGGMGGAETAFFLHALLRQSHGLAPVAVLDLGEIARMTWVDPAIADPVAPGACFAFDAGPGLRPGEAEAAAAGKIIGDLPERLLAHPFFAKAPPRRLDDPDLFLKLTEGLSVEDAATSRAAMTAAAVMQGLDLCPAPISSLYVCGLARSHRAALRMISAGLEIRPRPITQLIPDGDHMTAYAAAFLAVRARLGLPTTASGTTGVRAAVGGAEFAAPMHNEAKRDRLGLVSATMPSS